MYKDCKTFGGRPSRFGVIEIQTCPTVQRAREYTRRGVFSGTPAGNGATRWGYYALLS